MTDRDRGEEGVKIGLQHEKPPLKTVKPLDRVVLRRRVHLVEGLIEKLSEPVVLDALGPAIGAKAVVGPYDAMA